MSQSLFDNGRTLSIRRPFVLVGGVWLISRLLLAGVVVAAMIGGNQSFSQVVSHWDVQHFLAIAQHGYAVPTDQAFFPGLPALLALGARLGVPMAVAGTVLALVGSVLAAVALVRLAGPVAACLWLIAPTAIFTAVPYTEALFCAAAFWAWCLARDEHWAAAAACAGLACTFRVSGLFLIGGLGLIAITQVWRTRGWLKSLVLRWVWLLVPIAVLGGYELYLHAISGSWTAWLQAEQDGWARGFTTPAQAFWHTLQATPMAAWPGRPEVGWVFRAEIISMALGLVGAVWCLCKRQWAAFGFVGVQVIAFGTSWWYMSVNRAILGWFPVFALLAGLVTWRPRNDHLRLAWRIGVGVIIAADVVIMIIWAWLFSTGRWAS